MDQERRIQVRTDGEAPVKVDVVAKGQEKLAEVFDCNSRDFSLNGVRLHGNHSFAVDNPIDLVVHMAADDKDYSLSGHVKWVTATTENEHLTGVELSAEDSKDFAQWQRLFS